MKRKLFFCLFSLFFIFINAQEVFSSPGSKERIINSLKRSFPEEYLESVFNDPRFKIDSVIVRILNRKGGKADFSFIFTDESIERGRKFLRSHKDILDSTYSQFGTSPHVIASIFRIESDFGKYSGSHKAINAFYTLYSLSKSVKRKQSALYEMKYFLKLCYENNWDPFSIKSSWAGAIGLTQFIPSSYYRFAVDGDGDGVVDLVGSVHDAAASAANYLKENGWTKNKRRALFRYNRSTTYVDAVLKYAELIKPPT